MLHRLAKHLGFVLLSLACAGNVLSQGTARPDSTGQSFIEKNVSITGDAGVYGELYGISGIAGRRPPSSARLYFRPTVTLFNSFSMSFDFLLSTEGSSARQNINQLGINPSWGWGSAHLGDFTDMFTPFTFDGIMVRGAGINLDPGLFRFSAIGGYTQRAVDGGAGTGSFSRYMYGARLGVGKQEGSYFDLMFLRTRDVPSSLSQPQPTIAIVAPNGNDSWPIGNIENIRWGSSGITGNVRIELSRDGGATYEVLFDSVANTGAQPWVVTGPPTVQAIIRITSLEDSVSDVSDFPFSIGVGVADQQGTSPGAVVNTYAVTPEENLVLGADGRLALFGNAVTLSAEVDASAYTRDMRAPTIDSLGLPSALTGLFAPRTSSRADYAYNTQLAVNLSSFSAQLGYKYVGPGYTSLGVASLLPDDRQFTLATMFRVSAVSVNVNAGREYDNLLGQKSYTTTRNNIGGNVSLRASDNWMLSFMGSYLSMANDASNDTMLVDYSTFMAGLSQMFFVAGGGAFQSATLSYIYQTSADGNPLRQNSGLLSHSLNSSAVFGVMSNLSLIPSISLIYSDIGETGWSSTQTYSISTQHRALNNRLTTALSLGTSLLTGSHSIQAVLSRGISAASYVERAKLNGKSMRVYEFKLTFKSGNVSSNGTGKCWIGTSDGLPYESTYTGEVGGGKVQSRIYYLYNVRFDIRKPVN